MGNDALRAGTFLSASTRADIPFKVKGLRMIMEGDIELVSG
ncbi:MAG: hypothetical protein ABSB50_00230 [Terracidiphilus sp.]|jgi:hypothetical protein